MGTILGWSSPARDMLSKGQPFPVDERDAVTYGSVFGIGAVVGAIPAGAVSRAIGRRYGMILYEMFVISGWACLAVPKSVWMLIFGRILQGVGIGALCTIIPAYVGEISQPDVRGTLCVYISLLYPKSIIYIYIIIKAKKRKISSNPRHEHTESFELYRKRTLQNYPRRNELYVRVYRRKGTSVLPKM